MHTNWFSRLGMLGSLYLSFTVGYLELVLCIFFSLQVNHFPRLLLLYFNIIFLVMTFCYQLCRHFIFVDGSWATGKCPPLRKNYRIWFAVFCVCQTLFSLFTVCVFTLFFHPIWLLPQALLIVCKIALLVHAKRVFSAAATMQGY